MKKLFKNILLCSATSVLTLPIVCCSNKQDDSKTIEILSDIDDLTIMENEIHLSQPIEAKCYGSDKKEKSLDIKFKLSIEGNDTLPDWIFMTDNNEIMLSEGKDVGTYNFNLVAYNEKAGIYSNTKTFKVNVIQERHIVPDMISLVFENNKYCMYGEDGCVPIKVLPRKEGIDEKYLIKSCYFDIKYVFEEPLDLNGQKLFKFSDSNIDPNIIVSPATDKTFIGKYCLEVTATLIDDPSIKTTEKLDINIDNIYSYTDEKTKFVYSRKNSDDTWEIESIPEQCRTIANIPDYIQNKHVTRISKNLCSRSSAETVVQIILPETIDTIGESAFEGQTYLCLAEMPGVKYVENSAFKGASMLEYDTNKKEPNLITIGDSAFEGCVKLNFSESKDVEWIGDFAFKNAGLLNFECNKKVRYIGVESFAENSKLESFTIRTATPPVLGGATFSKSYNLKNIYVPADVVDEYKTDLYWREYKRIIEGIYK